MSETYLELAGPLNAACPPGYERAWIDAQVGDDWDDQTAWCEGPAGKTQPVIDPGTSFRMGRALRSLRREMAKPGQQPWSRCTFTLFPDGQFKFDVEYDNQVEGIAAPTKR